MNGLSLIAMGKACDTLEMARINENRNLPFHNSELNGDSLSGSSTKCDGSVMVTGKTHNSLKEMEKPFFEK